MEPNAERTKAQSHILPSGEEISTYTPDVENARILEEEKIPEDKLREEQLMAYQNLIETYVEELQNGTIDKDEFSRRIARHLLAKDLAAERLFDQANIDRLTRLPNLRAFQNKYRSLIQSGKPFGLLILDIDKFKEVNDTHGHPAGDTVLIETGLRITSQIRQTRVRKPLPIEPRKSPDETDLAARYGGEEFVVLLPGISNNQDLMTVGEKIRASIQKNLYRIKVGDNISHLSITASLGGGVFDGSISPKEFFKKVDDEGLYEAKKNGRNRVVVV